jgi:hypothetical protein
MITDANAEIKRTQDRLADLTGPGKFSFGFLFCFSYALQGRWDFAFFLVVNLLLAGSWIFQVVNQEGSPVRT